MCLPPKGGARLEVAEVETIGDRASRRRKLQEAKEARELEEKTRATEQAAIKQTGAAREKEFTRLLGPLHRAKPGTRVKRYRGVLTDTGTACNHQEIGQHYPYIEGS